MKFDQEIARKYHIYNSLFLRLPFELTQKTGSYLPILRRLCEEKLKEDKNPTEILHSFFEENMPQSTEKEQHNMLFSFIKYIERQVVLFDSVEAAAYDKVKDLEGSGSLKDLVLRSRHKHLVPELIEMLKNFHMRVVLTAHPTQFYPSSVLLIIHRLSEAIRNNNLDAIDEFLQQLAKTPFFSQKKPSPYEEAKSLIWYLKNTLYEVIPELISQLDIDLCEESLSRELSELFVIGFWPGGDRDGNPFVNFETTKEVALALKRALFQKYHKDLNILRKKLSFRHVQEPLRELEERAYLGQFNPQDFLKSPEELLQELIRIRQVLIDKHESIFLPELDAFINKVRIFELHFAELDIRQDSSVLRAVSNRIVERYLKLSSQKFSGLPESEQIAKLLSLQIEIRADEFDVEDQKDLIQVLHTIRWLQENIGERSCRRFIISNTQNAVDVIRLFMLARCTAWYGEEPKLDLVPLFETIDDLIAAPDTMSTLYAVPAYREHLVKRGLRQTIMLGFSDGTKDGGYLSSNWSIFQAKEALTKIAQDYGIELGFFDGRGGPPARGGGNAQKFYASMGRSVAHKQIQLTIQGQTISSNYGFRLAAKHNLEQLLSAGVRNAIFPTTQESLTKEQRDLFQQLSDISLASYSELKQEPKFLPYLQTFGPLNFYARTNIGSRPATRGGKGIESLRDLRAIPFVSTCSQIKQNIPGYYGLGTALYTVCQSGHEQDLISLYRESRFFRALIDNSIQSLKKCSFAVTAFVGNNEEYAELWAKIRDEYELTVEYIKKVSNQKELMEDKPDSAKSIALREYIMLPLVLIQQYALEQIRNGKTEKSELYEQMVIRSMYGIVNASRNSA